MLRYVLAVFVFIGVTQAQTSDYLLRVEKSRIDLANAVAADASGIYVAGERSDPSGISSIVVKYDAAGRQSWSQALTAPGQFSAPAGASPAVLGLDSSGIYVLAVRIGGPLMLRKYSADGTELWSRELGFSAPGALAVDSSGVYVTGRDFPPKADYLRKYNRDGSELWTKSFDNQTAGDPVGVAADGIAVYIFFRTGPQGELFTRKFDASGDQIWIRSLGLTHSTASVMAADASGFLVAANRSGEPVLRKYDAAGTESWTRLIDPLSVAIGIAVDSTGIYMAGRVQSGNVPFATLPGQCRSGSGGDSFVRRYDASGVELWTRQFGTSDAAWARGLDVKSQEVVHSI